MNEKDKFGFYSTFHIFLSTNILQPNYNRQCFLSDNLGRFDVSNGETDELAACNNGNCCSGV
jgi:hypothetical protein